MAKSCLIHLQNFFVNLKDDLYVFAYKKTSQLNFSTIDVRIHYCIKIRFAALTGLTIASLGCAATLLNCMSAAPLVTALKIIFAVQVMTISCDLFRMTHNQQNLFSKIKRGDAENNYSSDQILKLTVQNTWLEKMWLKVLKNQF